MCRPNLAPEFLGKYLSISSDLEFGKEAFPLLVFGMPASLLAILDN